MMYYHNVLSRWRERWNDRPVLEGGATFQQDAPSLYGDLQAINRTRAFGFRFVCYVFTLEYLYRFSMMGEIWADLSDSYCVLVASFKFEHLYVIFDITRALIRTR